MEGLFNNRKLRILILCICMMVPFSCITYGFDATDSGLILNSYKFVFTNPESTNLSTVFTSIIGNRLLAFLDYVGIPGYLGMKIFASLFSITCAYIVYSTLKDYFDKNLVLIGLGVALLLSRGHMTILMYNQTTAVFFILSASLLLRGLFKERYQYIFGSGIVLGFNTFVRLPNIVECILIISIIYYGIIKKQFKRMTRNTLFFLGGVLLSLVLSIVIIAVLFGANNFSDMIQMCMQQLVHSKDEHSVVEIIKINILQGLNGLLWTSLFGGIAICLDYMFCDNEHIIRRKNYIFSFAIVIPVIFTVLKAFGVDSIMVINKIYKMFYTIYQPMTIMVAFYCVSAIYYCFYCKTKDATERLIFIIGFLMVLAIPMGSDTGFTSYYHNFYFQSVVLVVIVKEVLTKTNCQLRIKGRNIGIIMQKTIVIFLGVYCISMFLVRNPTFVYRDRLKVTSYEVNNQKVKGIKTSQQRAEAINDLLRSITPYTRSGEKLITYGSIPIFCYLLDMPPFFHGVNGWVEIAQLSIDAMKDSMNESEFRKEYPLIIISNVGTNNSDWPDEETIEIMENIKASDEKYSVIAEYIEKNNYHIVFSNKYFQVYSQE